MTKYPSKFKKHSAHRTQPIEETRTHNRQYRAPRHYPRTRSHTDYTDPLVFDFNHTTFYKFKNIERFQLERVASRYPRAEVLPREPGVFYFHYYRHFTQEELVEFGHALRAEHIFPINQDHNGSVRPRIFYQVQDRPLIWGL